MSEVLKITLQVGEKRSINYILADDLINAIASRGNFINTCTDTKTGEQYRIIDKLFMPLGVKKDEIDNWISQNNS